MLRLPRMIVMFLAICGISQTRELEQFYNVDCMSELISYDEGGVGNQCERGGDARRKI